MTAWQKDERLIDELLRHSFFLMTEAALNDDAATSDVLAGTLFNYAVEMKWIEEPEYPEPDLYAVEKPEYDSWLDNLQDGLALTESNYPILVIGRFRLNIVAGFSSAFVVSLRILVMMKHHLISRPIRLRSSTHFARSPIFTIRHRS